MPFPCFFHFHPRITRYQSLAHKPARMMHSTYNQFLVHLHNIKFIKKITQETCANKMSAFCQHTKKMIWSQLAHQATKRQNIHDKKITRPPRSRPCFGQLLSLSLYRVQPFNMATNAYTSRIPLKSHHSGSCNLCKRENDSCTGVIRTT